MAKYYFSRNGEHIATGYTEEEMQGAGYFLLILIALPFFLAAIFIHRVAEFIVTHGVLISIIYFIITILISIYINFAEQYKYKILGSIGTLMNFVTLYLFNLNFLPTLVRAEGVLEILFGAVVWVVLSAVILIAALFAFGIASSKEDGSWNFLISILLLILGLCLMYG